MRLIGWLVVGCLLGGCATSPHEKAGPASPASYSQEAKAGNLTEKPPPIVIPPEDGDNERPRGEEIRRRPVTEQNHESDSNYHPPTDLRGIYAGYETSKIKTIVSLRIELLWKNFGFRDFTMRDPTHKEVGDIAGQRLFDELMEAKQELWRRWKAGDESAKLPEFAH